MINPMLALGALAQEMMKPQRVKDLEAFFNQYPAALAVVVQALQEGIVPLPEPIPQPGFNSLSEVANEASVLGLIQGLEPDILGPERPI